MALLSFLSCIAVVLVSIVYVLHVPHTPLLPARVAFTAVLAFDRTRLGIAWYEVWAGDLSPSDMSNVGFSPSLTILINVAFLLSLAYVMWYPRAHAFVCRCWKRLR